MQRILIPVLLFLSATTAHAQWRDTKHHLVLSAFVGGNYNFGNPNTSTYAQFIGRGMWYSKRMLAFGGDLGLTSVSGKFSNFDAINANAFAHLKLPLGLYAEGGLGASGVVSGGRTASYTNGGLFWAAGITKSFGPNFALDLQYRSAPSVGASDVKNYQSGLRLGASIKL
ncbi:MAG: hypothetical protein IT244_04455 [Bacteroidia bacterium]|nr:hypothetical protein [Bacteroidia bacterium]